MVLANSEAAGGPAGTFAKVDEAARAERSFAALEAAFLSKSRVAADDICRMLPTIELDERNHLGVENHARLARMSALASDISAQLSFFGAGPISDLARVIGRRLERRDGWDREALETVTRQAAELRAALGVEEASGETELDAVDDLERPEPAA